MTAYFWENKIIIFLVFSAAKELYNKTLWTLGPDFFFNEILSFIDVYNESGLY